MAKSTNPRKAEHVKSADSELKEARSELRKAKDARKKLQYGTAILLVAPAIAAASVAAAEARNAKDKTRTEKAQKVLREAGNILSESVEAIQSESRFWYAIQPIDGAFANPNGGLPGTATPSLLIRTYSSSLLTGADEIYLVVNRDGEVIDAVMTAADDFGPVQQADYGNLPILELDISGPQHRKLKKLAKRLKEVGRARPVFRPAAGGRETAGAFRTRYSPGDRTIARRPRTEVAQANPLKQRLMR